MNTDFLVIGAGIIGLTIARELKLRYPDQSITVLEKESAVGRHSSGRNSGVLHSGIYYPSQSLKAKVCSQGAREMADYCDAQNLPLKRLGKVLIPVHGEDGPQFDLLEKRAKENGIDIERLNAQQLKKLEPDVRSATGDALLIPSTTVGSPIAVMEALKNEVESLNIDIRFNIILNKIDPNKRQVYWSNNYLNYGHLINAAGLHADTVAHQFNVGGKYTLLPFKGLYWKLDPKANFNIRRLIYPVPDLRVPFLGVHTTTAIDGAIYLGPTAVPALGRENYKGFQDVSATELLRIGNLLLRQFIAGRDGFRRLAWQEGRRYFKPWFAEAAKALLPRLKTEHLLPCNKVGIRAQMLDKQTGSLVNDFLIERGQSSTHILNAISPAWTCSFPFARFVLDNFLEDN